MQKVDLVIAGVGVVALIATVAGVAFYDEVTGESPVEYAIAEDTDSLDGLVQGVGAGTQTFNLDVPDNGTSASFDVTVTFQGQAAFGSGIEITGFWIDPTGIQHDFDATTLTVAAQSAGGESVTLSSEFAWAMTPEDGEEVPAMVWDDPVVVSINIGGSSDQGAALPGGIVSYTYDVEVDGTLSLFREDTSLPNPTAGA